MIRIIVLVVFILLFFVGMMMTVPPRDPPWQARGWQPLSILLLPIIPISDKPILGSLVERE